MDDTNTFRSAGSSLDIKCVRDSWPPRSLTSLLCTKGPRKDFGTHGRSAAALERLQCDGGSNLLSSTSVIYKSSVISAASECVLNSTGPKMANGIYGGGAFFGVTSRARWRAGSSRCLPAGARETKQNGRCDPRMAAVLGHRTECVETVRCVR